MTYSFWAALAIGLAWLPGGAAAAPVYQDLHDFAGGGGDGDTPYSYLVADGQGRLYGTTYSGGTAEGGTVFRATLPKGGGAAQIEILHSFQGPEGAFPSMGVTIGADGGIYGTAYSGGAHGDGTVYRLDPVTLAVTDLHDFNPDGTPEDGSAPQGALTPGPNGLLYGTTSQDGPLGYGTVFAISPKGDTVSYRVIHAFGPTNDGQRPMGVRLVSSGKNLFGTTIFGGQFTFGVVFELSLGKGGVWTESGLYQFGTNAADATGPGHGVVLGKSGLLYGCGGGGSFGDGAAFSITPGKGGAPMAEAVIAQFGANPGDPFANGNCALTADKSGRLVGTTSGGGANASGTVFTLSPGGGGWTLAVPYSFGVRGNGDAVQPAAAVFALGKGFYAGTTPVGGANDKGALYRVKP